MILIAFPPSIATTFPYTFIHISSRFKSLSFSLIAISPYGSTTSILMFIQYFIPNFCNFRIVLVKFSPIHNFKYIILLHTMIINDFFQQIAYSLGYSPQDLLPIDPKEVAQSSQSNTRNMTQKEREFYFNKKISALMERQNKIIQQVAEEVNRQSLHYRVQRKQNNMNGRGLEQAIRQHQKIVQRNIKYMDTLHRKKIKDQQQYQRRISLSSNSNRSFRSNASAVSKRSFVSNKSSRSSVNKQRLIMVRSRQKQQQIIKKLVHQQKIRNDSKKSLKAEQRSLQRSRRTKTRSEIHKQIVTQNKQAIQLSKHRQIKDHLQQLKYKIQRTQQIRVKNAQRRQQRMKSSVNNYYNRTMQQENGKIRLRDRYARRDIQVDQRIQNQKLLQHEANQFNRMSQNIKMKNAQERRSFNEHQKEILISAQKQHQKHRLRTAQNHKNLISQLNKRKTITNGVKRELVSRKASIMQQRRKIQRDQLVRSMQRENKQLGAVVGVRNQLMKQRQRLREDMRQQRRALQVKTGDLKHQRRTLQFRSGQGVLFNSFYS